MAFFKNLYLDQAIFSDTTEPSNPGAGKAVVYKKTSDSRLYYKPDATGAEYDLTHTTDLSTGLLTGGELKINADTTKFDLVAGTGIIADHTVDPSGITNISWSTFSAQTVTNIATNLITFISINSSGAIVQSTTRPSNSERRSSIYIGVLVHVNNTNIDAIDQQTDYAKGPTSQMRDLFDAIGFLNISGNVMSAASNNLTVAKSAGTMLAHGSNYINDSTDPHITTLAALDTSVSDTFQYRMQDGSSSALTLTSVLPNIYDDGTSYPGATVPTNKFTIQRWFIFTAGNLKVQPGQTLYNSLELAEQHIAVEAFTVEPSIEENGLFIGYMIVQEGTTDLSDTSKAQFVKAGKFGAVSGVSGVATLQSTYDASNANPEILTSTTGGALTLRRGSAAEGDAVVEVQNNAGTAVSSITGTGLITGTNTFLKVDAAIDTDKTLTLASSYVHMFAPTAVRTVTLPLLSTVAGNSYTFIITGGTSSLIIATNATDNGKFEGGNSITMSEIGQNARVMSTGERWVLH